MEALGSAANSVFAIVVILGTCVFVHELGHYLAARLAGMRVEEFMIGFPPRLLSVTRGRTRYGIGVVPLGGFCKIAGMEPGQEAVEGGFYTRPRYWQAVVIAAGALMNVVLAIVVFVGLGMVRGVPVETVTPPEVEGLVDGDTAARRAGLQPGDSIIAVDGERTSLEIASIRPDSLASKAGLREGDTIVRVGDAYMAVPGDVIRAAEAAKGPLTLTVLPASADGGPAPEPRTIRAEPRELGLASPLPTARELPARWGVQFSPLTAYPVRQYIMLRPDKPILLTVVRNGGERGVTVTPTAYTPNVQEEDGSVSRQVIGQIGITFAMVRDYSPGRALREGGRESLGIVLGLVDMIRRLITREGGVAAVGPVGVIYLVHEQARVGWEAVVYLGAILNMNLAFVNLLPIPVVDGGRLAQITYEAVVRRRVNPRHEMTWLVAGLVLIGISFVAVTVKDVWNLIVYRTP